MSETALSVPMFRRYYAGAVAGVNGMWIFRVLMSWLAWDLTGDAAFVGLVAVASLLPVAVAGPVMGAVTDRSDIRRAFRMVSAGLIVCPVLLLAALGLQVLSPPILLGLALVFGIVVALYHPVRQSIGPRLVEPPLIGSVVALSALNFNLGRTIAPALGGVLIARAGVDETLTGALLTVLWENRPEPILSGREELGFNKLFADLPEPQIVGTSRRCRASWDGHGFFEMALTGLRPASPPKAAPSDGTLHYAYMPPMGHEGTHESRTRVMLSPNPPVTPSRIVSYEAGEAELTFARSSFEQLPTMFHIVNALADLPVLEMRGGFTLRGLGKSDLREQRMVREKPFAE